MEVGTDLNTLGLVYNNLGMYPDSIKHHKRSAEIYIKNKGMESEELARCYLNMGLTYMSMNQSEVGKDYMRKVCVWTDWLLSGALCGFFSYGVFLAARLERLTGPLPIL